MLLERETLDRFGYKPSELAPTSNKRVIYRCPRCEETFETTMLRFGRKKTEFCHRCSLKQRKGAIPKLQPSAEAAASTNTDTPTVTRAEPKMQPIQAPPLRGEPMDLNNPRMLSVGEMARLANINESYMAKCVEVGHVSPQVHAVEMMEPVGGQEREAAEANESGNPFRPRLRHVPAEETFMRFWKSIYGKARLLDPRCVAEVENLSRGFPADYRGFLTEKAVEKVLANIYTAMDDDEEFHELTAEEVMDARETA